jgi:aryl-alcohol dehydrogenase (NADP+)
MQFVNLGDSGIKVSRICLGCMTYGSKNWREWVLEEEASVPFIHKALDLGINFFDTADMYSVGESERIVGNALHDAGVQRDTIVIATKVCNAMSDDPNHRGLSRKHIRHSIDNSLRRLRTDYVDLYQIHRFDPDSPIEETVEALDDVVRQGKALHVGASSMWAWQFAKMLNLQKSRGLAKFITMQNHYNLAYREEEREMNPFCLSENIGLLPWSPLARGTLVGTRKAGTLRSQSDEYGKMLYTLENDDAIADRVAKVAAARNVKPAAVALAWLLHQPGVVAPIIGANKLHHLEDAVSAVDVKLSDEEIKQLEEPYEPHPVRGHK